MREDAVQALTADVVLTTRQLRAYYGVDERALRGLPFKDATVRPVHNRAATSARVRFYALKEDTLRCSANAALSHLAGAGAIRHQLGIAAQDWNALPESRDRNIPDAEFKRDGKIVAVEYDSGTYVRQLVKEKMEAFSERYDHVVWGAVSRVRAERLRRRHPDATVLDATWWE